MTSPPIVCFKRLHEDAHLPTRATRGSVGWDLYAYRRQTESQRPGRYTLPPKWTTPISTGLAIELPPGHFGFVCSRSGMAKELSVFVTNAPGIIDPDYRGELFVLLYNGGHETQYVQHDDRIGQLLILPAVNFVVGETEELSSTERGSGGFGSTGR